MLEAISGFLSGLKQASPQLLLGLAMASGLVLFTPTSFLGAIGLDAFQTEHKLYIGGAFVVSVALLLAQAAFELGTLYKAFRAQRTAEDNAAAAETARRKHLHELTPDEKAYLIPYVLGSENTQYFLMEDGVSGGLQTKGIIYRSSNIGNIVTGWAFNIQPWARAYLSEHPQLLEGANPSPSGPPRW